MLGVLGRSEETIRSQISEALVLLCSQVFHYDIEVTVEALVGVKIDKKEVFLFNVHNTTNKDEERRMTSGIMNDEEDDDDIEAIMINQDSDSDSDDDIIDAHYSSHENDNDDERDPDNDNGPGGGNMDTGDRGHHGNRPNQGQGDSDSQDDCQGRGRESEKNAKEGEPNENEAESNENEAESNENEAESDDNEESDNRAGAEVNDDDDDNNCGGNEGKENERDQQENGKVKETSNTGDNQNADLHEKSTDETDAGADKNLQAKVQSDNANTVSEDGSAADKSNSGPIKRVPRQIILPPLSKMVTRSKRKRPESESDDQPAPKRSQYNMQSAAAMRSGSTSKDGGLNLHIKDSYSVKVSGGQVTQNRTNDDYDDSDREDDLVFIKEEVTDPGYERNSTRTTGSVALASAARAKTITVASPRPIAPATAPQTIFLQHMPGSNINSILGANVVTTNSQAFRGGLSSPIFMPATGQSTANKPIVFFTKNHRGELVQVKPPPNMKIMLPPSTQASATVSKSLTLTKTVSSSPSQGIISGLSNNPGLKVLQTLERNANISPVVKQANNEPQIRVIQVTPEAAKVPNRYSINYERDTDHPAMIDKDGSRIKRPMNAFMIWAKEARSRILNESGGTLQNADVSKILGQRWRNMNRDEQQPYYDEQRRLDMIHKAHYPEYKYQPRRKKPNSSRPYDSTNIISLSPGSVIDHDTMYMNESSSASFSSSADRILTSGSPSSTLGTISLCPEEFAEDILGSEEELIATPVSASDIIPDLPNLASALAASAAYDDLS